MVEFGLVPKKGRIRASTREGFNPGEYRRMEQFEPVLEKGIIRAYTEER